MMIKTILIVDDSASVRIMLADSLSNEGYLVNHVDNGKQGLAFIQQNKPDLVICDLNMPEMDGFRLLEMLRSEEENQSLPVIMISVDSSEEILARLKKIGCDIFLLKPVEVSTLLSTIQMLSKQQS